MALNIEALTVGDTVRIDWPSSDMHGKRVRVVGVDHEFDLASEGSPPVLVRAVIVEHPIFKTYCVLGAWAIAGTVEAVARRRADTLEADEAIANQRELFL